MFCRIASLFSGCTGQPGTTDNPVLTPHDRVTTLLHQDGHRYRVLPDGGGCLRVSSVKPTPNIGGAEGGAPPQSSVSESLLNRRAQPSRRLSAAWVAVDSGMFGRAVSDGVPFDFTVPIIVAPEQKRRASGHQCRTSEPGVPRLFVVAYAIVRHRDVHAPRFSVYRMNISEGCALRLILSPRPVSPLGQSRFAVLQTQVPNEQPGANAAGSR